MPQPLQEVLPDRLAESQEPLPATLVEIGDTQASVVEPPVDSQVPPSQPQSQAETVPGEPAMTTPRESIVQTMHPSPMPPPAAPGPNPPRRNPVNPRCQLQANVESSRQRSRKILMLVMSLCHKLDRLIHLRGKGIGGQINI